MIGVNPCDRHQNTVRLHVHQTTITCENTPSHFSCKQTNSRLYRL